MEWVCRTFKKQYSSFSNSLKNTFHPIRQEKPVAIHYIIYHPGNWSCGRRLIYESSRNEKSLDEDGEAKEGGY